MTTKFYSMLLIFKSIFYSLCGRYISFLIDGDINLIYNITTFLPILYFWKFLEMLPIPVNMMFRPTSAAASSLSINQATSRNQSQWLSSFSDLDPADLEKMLPHSPVRNGNLNPSETTLMKEIGLDQMISPDLPLRRQHHESADLKLDPDLAQHTKRGKFPFASAE